MVIRNRIINTKKYLADINNDDQFVVGVQLDEISLKNRFSVLKTEQSSNVYSPKISNGINARRNTIGEYKPDKTSPKETCYRAQHWEVKDWGWILA